MLVLDWVFNYGFAVGFLIADDNEKELLEIKWGVALHLGFITLYIEKESG